LHHPAAADAVHAAGVDSDLRDPRQPVRRAAAAVGRAGHHARELDLHGPHVTGYLIRRLWHALLVVIGVTIVVFIMLHLLPGGPARAILGIRATPAAIAAFNHANGYDRPLFIQYGDWLGHLITGQFGYSYKL